MVIPVVLSEVIPPSPVALRRTSHSAVIASQRVGAKRRPMTGSAKQSIAPSKERMDCFVARAPRNDGGELCIQFSDLSKDVNPRSRGAIRPRLAFISRPRKQRAQGMPGARCARTLVCDKKQTHERRHHGHTGTTRHSPRNGFTAYFALSPVTRLG